jgi:hypothetical protein
MPLKPEERRPSHWSRKLKNAPSPEAWLEIQARRPRFGPDGERQIALAGLSSPNASPSMSMSQCPVDFFREEDDVALFGVLAKNPMLLPWFVIGEADGAWVASRFIGGWSRRLERAVKLPDLSRIKRPPSAEEEVGWRLVLSVVTSLGLGSLTLAGTDLLQARENLRLWTIESWKNPRRCRESTAYFHLHSCLSHGAINWTSGLQEIHGCDLIEDAARRLLSLRTAAQVEGLDGHHRQSFLDYNPWSVLFDPQAGR